MRANRGNGLYTEWSGTATYVVGQLDDPQAGADMTPGPPMQDVSHRLAARRRGHQVPAPGGQGPRLQQPRRRPDRAGHALPAQRHLQQRPVLLAGACHRRGREPDAVDARQRPSRSSATGPRRRSWSGRPTSSAPPSVTRCTSSGAPCPTRRATSSTSPRTRTSRPASTSPAPPPAPPTTSARRRPDPTPVVRLSQGQTFYWRVRAIDDSAGRPGHLLEHPQVRLRHRSGHPDLAGRRRRPWTCRP